MNNKVCKDVKAIMLLPWQKQCSVLWLCDRFTHNCVTGFCTVLPSTSTCLCEGTIPSRFLNHISPMWLRDAHLWSGSAGFYTNSAFRGRDSRYHWDISEPSGSSRSLGSCKTKIAEILNIIKHLTPYITWRSAGVWFCPNANFFFSLSSINNLFWKVFLFHFQGCGASCGKCDCSGVKGTKVRFMHFFSRARTPQLPVSFLPLGVGSAGRPGTGPGWGRVMEQKLGQEQIAVWIRACLDTQLGVTHRCTQCFLRHLLPFRCPTPDIYYKF